MRETAIVGAKKARAALPLSPRSVALIGASARPGGIGHRITRHALAGGFAGDIFLVNPRYDELFGRRCYRRLADIGAAPEMCVLLVPTDGVLAELEASAAAGAEAVVIIAAGHEAADYPAWLEAVRAFARRSGVRVFGPNTVGLILDNCRLHASFAPMLEFDDWVGGGAFVTQSGGLTAPFHEAAVAAGLGVRYMIGTGTEVDATTCDCLDAVIADPEVTYCVAFVEGCADAWRFGDISRRAVERGVPLFLLKGGRSAKGRLASLSHTGRSSSSARIYRDLCDEFGIGWLGDEPAVRIALQALPLAGRMPARPRIACIASSGGISTLIADACEDRGVALADFSADTRANLGFLKSWGGSDGNPIDASAQLLARSDIFERICAAVLADASADVVLVSATARLVDVYADALRRLAAQKPLAFASVGRMPGEERCAELAACGVAVFSNAADAVRGIAALSAFAAARAEPSAGRLTPPRPGGATRWLSPREGMAMLSAAGTPAVPRAVIPSAAAIAGIAEGLGYPMVLKIDSAEVPHKAAVGGLIVGIGSEGELTAAHARLSEVARGLKLTAYEIVAEAQLAIRLEVAVSVFADPEFGPLVMVARGGRDVEHTADRLYGSLCLDRPQALAMLARGPLPRLLAGIAPEGLADCIVAACRLFESRADLREVEINPVAVLDDSGRCAILDALVGVSS